MKLQKRLEVTEIWLVKENTRLSWMADREKNILIVLGVGDST